MRGYHKQRRRIANRAVAQTENHHDGAHNINPYHDLRVDLEPKLHADGNAEKQNRDKHVTHKNECAFVGFCVNFLTFRKMTCKVIHNNLRYCNVITTRARCQRGLQF